MAWVKRFRFGFVPKIIYLISEFNPTWVGMPHPPDFRVFWRGQQKKVGSLGGPLGGSDPKKHLEIIFLAFLEKSMNPLNLLNLF